MPLPVHSVDKKGLSVPDSVSCFRCGGKHYATTCKLKSVTCNNCGKTGHIAKVCRSNPTGAKSSAARQKGKAARGHSPEKENSPPREGSKGHSLYNFSSSSNKLFRVTLQVNGVNLPMEIDTGAAVSILSEATYKVRGQRLPGLHWPIRTLFSVLTLATSFMCWAKLGLTFLSRARLRNWI